MGCRHRPGTLCWERVAGRKARASRAYRLCLGLLSLSQGYPPSTESEGCCQLANREGLVQLKQLKVGADQWPRPNCPQVPLSYQNCHQSTRTSTAPRASTNGKTLTQQTLTRLRHPQTAGMADAVQQQLEQAEVPTKGCPSSRAAKPAGRTHNWQAGAA